MLVLKVAQTFWEPLQNSNPLTPVLPQRRRWTQAWWKQMINPARMPAFYPKILYLHKWRRIKKQTHRKTMVLKMAESCRERLQNSNILNPELPKGRRWTQAWWKQMTNPARLMASKSRHFNLCWAQKKKQTHRKTLVLKVKQNCRKSLRNSNHLTPLLTPAIWWTQTWFKNMTNPGRITAFFLRLWCLHKWRR